MGDSESFTSLMDLVNSHLSKTSLNTSQSGDEGSSFPLASVRIQTGMSQTVFTPPNGIMPIPRLGPQDNEINGILAQQVSNMLMAKEKTRQAEETKQRLEQEINQLKHQTAPKEDYNIDLMSSIILPSLDQMLTHPSHDTKRASISSSVESLLTEVTHDTDKVFQKFDTLPLNQDMSYMLVKKVRRCKPSAFGKVICSRVRPVAAPYLKIDVTSNQVHRFDFTTQSPCDINLEKRRHPPQDPYANMNMVERFMAQTNSDSLHHKT